MDETVSIKDKISGFEKKMAGIVEHATRNFATLRVGFARPDFLEGMSIYQKNSCFLDALCQAVESWWSLKAKTTKLTALSRKM